MNKENHRFSTNKALKLHNINAWCMHYIKYKQSEDDHQKADEEQCKISWWFKDVKNNLIQKDNWKWEDFFIIHHKKLD